ncbi:MULTISPECIES: hypothetical protein [unclassified Sphingopyxis]|uniref:hypothetical protein n=1 Tax=unclassified Sphingopyxis TaxID=2614943 RepID=UPI0007360D09|nr:MULTISPECIES: hypothetical protein [unclassified Sphingopyxis]KTE31693.1 hypothetical protein ATE62_19420 [Sphingopyxis sp. HIX]KTE70535.1 hypothetical protein ATE72_22780 [Sphingopyxis sp. HXXIV]
MIRALAVAVLWASPVPAMAQYDGDWVCNAVAKGSRGAQVDVIAQVGSDGEIWSRSISWTPPMLDASKPQYRDLDRPGLSLQYDDAEAEAIGELTSAIGDVSSVGGPVGALRDLKMLVLMDGGASWTTELEPFGVSQQIGGSPFRYASAEIDDTDWDGDPYELFEAGGVVTLSLQDAVGRPVAQARYDIGAKAERDRLFRSAWRKAEAMAKSRKGCDKAGA